MIQMSLCLAVLAGVALMTIPAAAQPADAPLQLEGKIPLGAVRGRIDHMAIDNARHRLFVAELGNGSVSVVDLEARKVVHRLEGMREPQGIAYLPGSDTLVVANGGDGSARLFHGPDYAATGRIELGDDADNVRLDATRGRVIVGYGGGALAIVDPATRNRIANIPLPAHPESFQLDAASNRIYVNVPTRRAVVVVDREAAKQVASWPMNSGLANFPMALDAEAARVLVVYRYPPRLAAYAMQDGTFAGSAGSCGDADDLFLDGKRHRIYVSCGEGAIDVIDAQTYQPVARLPTVSGARTSYFAPELDLFMLAVRAAGREPAAIWLYRPTP